MNTISSSSVARWLGVVAVGLLVGCGTAKPGKVTAYPVRIDLDPSLRGKSVAVDVVGVNRANYDRWSSYPMSNYWKDGDVMRGNALKKTFNFVSSSELSGTLAVTDAIWKQWQAQGISHLFVLADLPGAHSNQPGTQDVRRQILPLNKGAWAKGTKELKVLVRESGIDVLTPLAVK